jgi:cytidylate kinase
MKSVDIPGIRLITVSGRIASGSTTLARQLSKILDWKHLEGGAIFWDPLKEKLGVEDKDTNMRLDKDDLDFDASLKKILKEGKNLVVETKLAAFNALGVDGVYKILVVCNDDKGTDQTQIRIDRLANRKKISIKEAKKEILEREKNDLKKWQKLYASGDKSWVYWDKKYYDLIINTYSHDQKASLKIVLDKIGYKK